MSGPVARLDDVHKRYDETVALDGVSLDVHAGECLALIGHNGSGKSTLMKLILGVARPDAGRLEVLGVDPGSAHGAAARAAIGFLPESIAFDPGKTGRQVLRFMARLRGLPPDDAEPLLERVGIEAAAARRVGGYSKGMRQRLGLAQALLGHPSLLLLDEPTTGLDPALRRQFYEIIGDATARGTAVLISSHALSELQEKASRLAILGRGRLLASGTLDEIKSSVGVPCDIRVRTEACRGERVVQRLETPCDAAQRDAETVVLSCREEDKLPLMRELVAMGEWVVDIETVPPRLDDLYLHFAEGGRT